MSTPICNCVDIDELADKVAATLESRRTTAINVTAPYVGNGRKLAKAVRKAIRRGMQSGGMA